MQISTTPWKRLWDDYAEKQQDKKLEKELKKACDGVDDGKWTETGCVIDEYEPTEEQLKERAKMTQSKSFEKFVESKGIDIDDDYHWLSAQEQEQIETEFKEDKSDEYAEEINSKKEDEGKRYVNPDGGAPLYEDVYL